MRSALSQVPQISNLETEPGNPGTARFQAAKGFDYAMALDEIVAAGNSHLRGYKG